MHMYVCTCLSKLPLKIHTYITKMLPPIHVTINPCVGEAYSCHPIHVTPGAYVLESLSTALSYHHVAIYNCYGELPEHGVENTTSCNVWRISCTEPVYTWPSYQHHYAADPLILHPVALSSVIMFEIHAPRVTRPTPLTLSMRPAPSNEIMRYTEVGPRMALTARHISGSCPSTCHNGTSRIHSAALHVHQQSSHICMTIGHSFRWCANGTHGINVFRTFSPPLVTSRNAVVNVRCEYDRVRTLGYSTSDEMCMALLVTDAAFPYHCWSTPFTCRHGQRSHENSSTTTTWR